MSAVQNNSSAAAATIPASVALVPATPVVQARNSALSQVTAAVRGKIFSFLSMQDRAQVHCVNRENSSIVELLFYGQVDKDNKILSQQFIREKLKLKNELNGIDNKIKHAKASLKALNAILINGYSEDLGIDYWNALSLKQFSLNKVIEKLEKDKVALTPVNTRYKAAMKMNVCLMKIMDLFGGRKKFEAVPVIPISSTGEEEAYIRFSPDQLTASVMRGVELSGRVFFVIRARVKFPGEWRDGLPSEFLRTETIFQRYAGGNSWANQGDQIVWPSGYIINDGKTSDHNLPFYYNLATLIQTGRVDFLTPGLLSDSPPRRFVFELE